MPFLGVEQLTERLGRYRWIEGRLFELLGGWVQAVDDLEAKRLLAEQSRRHGRHEQLLESVQPNLWSRPKATVVTPTPGAASLSDALDQTDLSTLERLVGVHRVLMPELVAAYAHDLAAMRPISDEPVRRVLTIVHRDAADDQRAGDAVVERLLRDAGAGADGVGGRRAAFEQALADGGGLLGESASTVS